MLSSQFLQPITPPRKAEKTNISINQYTPQTAQAVQFSMQQSMWQIPVIKEPAQRPRHGTTDASESRPLNNIARKEKNGWKCLGKTETVLLYKLFQDWVMYLVLNFRMRISLFFLTLIGE